MIIAGAVAKWFFTRYMQSILEHYNLWRWLACFILCITLLVGCWPISGEFSSRVNLDRLHCNWIALERLYQQYDCTGQALSAEVLLSTGFISSMIALDRLYQQKCCSLQALSAVRLHWTGFISRSVALYRLYQQYGCSGQVLSAVGLLLISSISSRALWAGFITSKCGMDRFYTTALHST